MELKEKLVELRRQKGLTQDEVARELGITRQAVSKWERGVIAPATVNLVALGRLYGVPLDEIVNGGPPVAVEEPEAPLISGKRGFLITVRAGVAICCLAFAIIIVCFFLLNSGSRKPPTSVPIEKMDWEDIDITDPSFIPWDGGGWNVIEE